jgi:LmbE family N-acetylglucosaminyl deacetylase
MADQKLDILFTAPHPDDIEIGCGGTVALLVDQGYRVGMIHMTSGEPTPRGTPETRAAESRAAAEVLGVAVCETLELPNRELMDGPATRYALATCIRKYQAPIIVGMAGRTPAASPDHYQAQLITEASRFYSQFTKWDDRFDNTAPHRVDHMVYRPVGIAAERHHFHSQFVVDITSTIDRKLEAIRCYASQFDGPRYERIAHHIRSLAGTEGGRCGYLYGELYALPRPLGVKDMIATLGQWEVPPPFVPSASA